MSAKAQFREVRAHKMEGKPPNGAASWQTFAESIPVYPSVDKDLLYEGDDKPFHIVLDLAALGAVSANGLIYDEELMAAMEGQLPGLGGLRGHLSEGDDSTYPIEMIDWVGHARVSGTIYGKGYIAPGPDRDGVRRIIARGGELRTSLDVVAFQEWVDKKAGQYRLRGIDFHTIDLVHSKKAALRKDQSGQAFITRETEKQEESMPPEDETVAQVSVNLSEVEGLRSQINTLTEERTTAQEALQAAQQETRRYAAVVGTIRVNLGYGDDVSDDELTAKLSEMYGVFNRLAERLGHDVSIDVAVAELLSFKQETVQREAERQIDDVVKSFTESWRVTSEGNKSKIAKLHKSFKRALQTETAQEGETLEALAERVWKEDFQMMADSILQAIGGPAAVVSSITQTGEKPDLSEAELKDARRFLPGR